MPSTAPPETLHTRHGPIPLPYYAPVTTLDRFDLDSLLLPYLPRLAPCALISVPELLRTDRRSPLPRLPMLVDSGGFLAFRGTVEATGTLGTLHYAPDDRPDPVILSPQQVWATQCQFAAVAFTLDFPYGGTDPDEQTRRAALSHANTLWALAQPRPAGMLVFASVQHDALDRIPEYLAAGADGVAIGGLVPFARDHDRVRRAVTHARHLAGTAPVHVFGLGHPINVRVALDAGASGVDSSSALRAAADGRSWDGQHLPDATPVERLRLAMTNINLGVQSTQSAP